MASAEVKQQQALQLAKSMTTADIKDYIQETLPADTLALGLCTPDNLEDWIDGASFIRWAVRRQQQKSTGRTAAATDTASSMKRRRSPSPVQPSGPKSTNKSKKKKSKPPVELPDTFELTESESDDEVPKRLFTVVPSKGPTKAQPAVATNSQVKLENVDDVITIHSSGSESSDVDSDTPHIQQPQKKRARKDATPINVTPTLTRIAITREVYVEAIIEVDKPQHTWTVPPSCSKFAYRLDLTNDAREWKRGKKLMSAAAIIKAEDLDSWKGGSGGGVKNGVKVPLLGNTLCRVVDHNSWFEPNEDDTRRLFNAERTVNAKDSASSLSAAASFYRAILATPCPAKVTNEAGNIVQCDGTPAVRKFSAKSKAINRDGKTMFIGCTKYRDGNSKEHRHDWIRKDLDEEVVKHLFNNQGELPQSGSSSEAPDTDCCARVLHPSSGLKSKECPYHHTKDGKVVIGKIIHRPCPVKIRIYCPFEPEDRRAVIYFPSNAGHNHPAFPHTKLTRDARDRYEAAILTLGTTGSTVGRVDNAPSTRQLFGGLAPGAAVPSLASAATRRRIYKDKVKEMNPRGTGLEGVMYELGKDAEKDMEDRYLHKVVSEGALHIIVTMLPALANRIHDATATLHDNTYKRTHGEWKEWEVVIWDRSLSMRITVARVYTTKETRAAFRAMWGALWDTVEKCTGRQVNFKPLDGYGLKAIVVDGDKQQVDGCGDDLVQRAALRDPTEVLITERDPQIIVQYLVKTCSVHLERKFTEMEKKVPKEDMDRIRSVVYLETQEERDELVKWCKKSKHAVVKNWIVDKDRAPWFIPSINQYASKMDPEDWKTTPSHTNLNESAHPYTNMHTGTNLSILDAIRQAHQLDSTELAKIVNMESNFVLGNNRNTQHQRDKSNLGRQKTRTRKIIKQTEVQKQLAALTEQAKDIDAAKKSLKSLHGIKRASPVKRATGGKAVANLEILESESESGSGPEEPIGSLPSYPDDIPETPKANRAPSMPMMGSFYDPLMDPNVTSPTAFLDNTPVRDWLQSLADGTALEATPTKPPTGNVPFQF
ncbi:hypothetical protein DFP72DRAFT_1126840 [Ephemerocybe angulata]|uniref:Uncharacterized protein n=1 Tax=Ephemerocybe angulata TaxID=980116 RepID=A0A8H6M5Q9_9AGAR|nr:hypothetical protein DFP72DRAFT_1126840 [Tulosesus angulatus]